MLSNNNHTVAQWLSYIESLHPKTISMGLDRVNRMIERLNLRPSFSIIVVAGTNGKGSTTAMLENIYAEAGYQVGCYTSPHLLEYNERIRVNQKEINNQALCEAFLAVESARVSADEPIQLTYFEYGTLAAIWHLTQNEIDIAILEVGLGGRLDAVNAFDADCAIVTNVDLDHQDYLGDTRELIGFEKSGVYRKNKPAICGDSLPPVSLIAHAESIGANLQRIGKDFSLTVNEDHCEYVMYDQTGHSVSTTVLAIPLLIGSYQLNNAACAIAATQAMQPLLAVDTLAISRALKHTKLSGRFEVLIVDDVTVILDVGHNPHAANALSLNLNQLNEQAGNHSKMIAVFAMLADKDIFGVVSALQNEIDHWLVASIDEPRGASGDYVADEVHKAIPNASVNIFPNSVLAFKNAMLLSKDCKAEGENAKIVVFGSFFTVSSIKQYLKDKNDQLTLK
jgi:dihydrofolate synthase / folylpolyglutamate synthase